MTNGRDHGGGLDQAISQYGGCRSGWIDLSTGINPVPYPVGKISDGAWTALPDTGAVRRLECAARRFWSVPDKAAVLAAPGASALIARLPAHLEGTGVHIPKPTYNEHAAAFDGHGWGDGADALVVVHPNNPDGRFCTQDALTAPQLVIDESFCDIAPDKSLIEMAAEPGCVVLKSFGKFWGLAGLRLGFAIGDPRILDPLAEALGPWPVAGPALEIGARALEDHDWAQATRMRLEADAARLDQLLQSRGATCLGGTPLFRLYDVGNAELWQGKLASAHIWTRRFPYSESWLRLGLPEPDRWDQLEAALA